MAESFGARLRARREQQHISLDAIVEATKIKLSLLEGLERDDVSKWPSGIFRRGYMRAYAHAIGLNPDDVVREFLDHYPDPEEGLLQSAENQAAASGGSRSGVRRFVSSALAQMTRRAVAASERTVAGLDNAARLPAQRPFDLDVAGDVALPRQAAWDLPSPGHELQSATVQAEAKDQSRRVDQSDSVDRADPGYCADATDAIDARNSDFAAGGPVSESRAGLSEPRAIDAESSTIGQATLTSIALVCTRLGQVETAGELLPLLAEALDSLGGAGLIVWAWNPDVGQLTPLLASGYPEKVVAQLPALSRDDDNATAEAFRRGQPTIVNGSDRSNGALVVPLMRSFGCVGVLAIELPSGSERDAAVSALATILAAQLATMVDVAPAGAALDRKLAV